VSIARKGKLLSHLVAACCLMFAAPAFSQFASGIEATVVDPSGAAVPGAEIVLTNQATQVSQSAKTNGQGLVRVLQLSPGLYKAEVHAPGFQTWQLTDIRVEGDDVRTIYPKLKLGEQTMTVSVTADAEQVETTKGNIGRTLEPRTIEDSPMIGQNIYASVATLAPGVTGLGSSANISAAGSVGTSSFNAESGYQINAAGQRQEANEFQLDGTVVDGASRDGVVNITPEPETVQEMKVTASVFSAEKGRQSGALLEIFTKSGTNRFHGMVSEFHTDSGLMARTHFQTVVPKYVRNDFGGAIGGPIFKDRTFFFGSLFWERSVQGTTLVRNVETQAFTNYVKTNFPNSIGTQFLTQAPPAVQPTSNFLTVSQLATRYGTITPTTIPGSLIAIGTANINASPLANGFQGHLRLDHNMRGGRDKFFFSFFRNTTNGESADGRPVYSYTNPNGTMYAKIDYLHTFSPHLINEAGVSFVRNTGSQSDVIPSLPNVYYIGGLSDDFSQWGPSNWTQNNFIYQDGVSYTHGRHSFHVGIDIDRQQDLDNFTNGLVRPFFYFLSPMDFAIDRPYHQGGPVVDLSTRAVAHNLYQRIMMLYIAPYIQDDWKITPRLTLNLGLRLDDFGHLSTVQNGQQAIAFFTPSPGSDFATQVANGSMQVRGANGAATTGVQYRITPRVGFAWDVLGTGKLSLHGGYGIYSDKLGEYSYVNNMRTNPPGYANPSLDLFSGATASQFSYGTSSSGAQGFAPPPGLSYTVDSHGGLVGTRTQVAGLDPNLQPPMVHSWALGLQHAIGGFVFEADYLGTASRKLYIQTDVNRYAGDMIIHNGTQLRLNPSFAGVIYGRNVGIANTNYGAFGISRRFAHRWTAHATYTWGKSLDYISSNDNGVAGGEAVYDAQHPEAQYARSDYDARHRFSGDAVWSIPGVGHGLVHAVTDGFTLSPIVILQSGESFNVYTSAPYASGGDYNGDGYGYDMPNVPSFGRTKSVSRSAFLTGIFPTSAFPVPAKGQEGNLGRNTYDAPGFANVNLAVQRSFPLHFLGDAGKFELRGEFLNAFNRVNLTGPVGDLSNVNFGKSTGQFSPRQIQLVGHIRF
jgi:hypothetical protein